MDLQLKGKVALITGGTVGIGQYAIEADPEQSLRRALRLERRNAVFSNRFTVEQTKVMPVSPQRFQ